MMEIAIETSSRLLENRYIDSRSGFSSITTSMNCPSRDEPMTRMASLSVSNIASIASTIADQGVIVRVSTS